MATTTTNNGWDIPQSSDYVKLGADAIAELGQDIDTSVGTGLLAWATWAPTLSGGWANGNGVWTASYAKLGKTVNVRGKFVVGSTTTKGTGLNISLPVTASANAVLATSLYIGYAVAGGSSTVQLSGFVASTTTITLNALNAAGTYVVRANVSATVPATWATSDEIYFSFTYEAA
jgi:hypothetical protein